MTFFCSATVSLSLYAIRYKDRDLARFQSRAADEMIIPPLNAATCFIRINIVLKKVYMQFCTSFAFKFKARATSPQFSGGIFIYNTHEEGGGELHRDNKSFHDLKQTWEIQGKLKGKLEDTLLVLLKIKFFIL